MSLNEGDTRLLLMNKDGMPAFFRRNAGQIVPQGL